MRSNPYQSARPGSFASSIRLDAPAGCRIAMLGLPDDTGVKMNDGRAGAAGGPRAFREALCRYGSGVYRALGEGSMVVDLSALGVFDAGDVQPGDSLDATHQAVTARVRELLSHDLLPVCIGGGHDLTWPAVRALAERHPELRGVYFDAHLDVREEPGSGMAFRRILTETSCSRLIVAGLDPFANARAHIEWFQANGGSIEDDVFDSMRDLGDGPVFASFDLDVINAAQAPGVSAINVTGWSAQQADHQCFNLGADPRIIFFDIMELNPAFDIDGRTARLAARLFLSFIAGYAQRAAS